VLLLAAAFALPYLVVFLRYRRTWWAAGISTLYYGAAAVALDAQIDAGARTDAEAEPLFIALGLPWLVIVGLVVVHRVRARRRLRRIQAFLDANPVPDTIPEWVTRSVRAAPRRRDSDVFRLRYEATCAVCGCHLPKRARARWDRERKAATCVACVGVTTAPRPWGRRRVSPTHR